MGTVLSVNVSQIKGIDKNRVDRAMAIAGFGLKDDAHAGEWDRQISIFPIEALAIVPPEKYDEVTLGGYTENITVSGIPLDQFIENSVVQIGSEVVIQIKHVGKDEFKEAGRPYIVSREGRFGIVVQGGTITVGDAINLLPPR